MKILIDTNIFLDLLLKRNFYKEALTILTQIASSNNNKNPIKRHLILKIMI